MKTTILTSSRADYGILRPLIIELSSNTNFEVSVVAFGTHFSSLHGNTIQEIEDDGIEVSEKIDTLVSGSDPKSISEGIGYTYKKFATYWSTVKTDLIVCLGDRFEMFAAVGASVPFNIPVAHISGGEITTGAIDNIYRNSLTLMSKYHFASAEPYKKNIINLLGKEENIYNVGALNYDNLMSMEYYSKDDLKKRFDIDFTKKTCLITFHPETVSYENNKNHIYELILALEELNTYQQIITMPNADTNGNLIREQLISYSHNSKNDVMLIESLGWRGYLSTMKHCDFMLGNSSSGFVEASFFQKKVINIGDRQNGRLLTKNIFCCKIEKEEILNQISLIEKIDDFEKIDLYGNGDTSNKIVKILSSIKQ